MTRTTSELATPCPNFRPTPARGCQTHDIRFCAHQNHIHGRSSMESRLEIETYRPGIWTLPRDHNGLWLSDLQYCKLAIKPALNTYMNILYGYIIKNYSIFKLTRN
ncbi:hypothetical protein AVEN_142566-1 [Araneus ventricosus]|uniref:Uncharacterized protein n=1 Tax=Araneus ventricosus TaxID=182803 RepID=A0A4Y2CG44_ARAVE|nr:hypothetical protein AVEN_142566-1 [Araneus ventricosus]